MATATRYETATAVEGPVPAPRRPRERRWTGVHASLAVLLVAAGGLGTGVLVAAAGAQAQVLAVARDVAYGTRLAEADVVVVAAELPPGVRAVPADDLSQVVGAWAAQPLPAGSLLSPAMVTASPLPGPGEHAVGVALPAGRLPARQPQPGDRVLLVATGEEPAGAGGGPMWTATVAGVSGGDEGLFNPGGSRLLTLDVVVPAAHGPQIARLAAAGELAVVLVGGAGR